MVNRDSRCSGSRSCSRSRSITCLAMVKPRLYVKTGCPWCDEVIDYLDARGIVYEKITVSGNHEAMQVMVDLSGQSKAPTMDWAGEVLADFGVDELVPFLRARGVWV